VSLEDPTAIHHITSGPFWLLIARVRADILVLPRQRRSTKMETMNVTKTTTLLSVGVGVVGVLAWWLQHTYGEQRTPLRDGKILVRLARWPIIGIAHKLSVNHFLTTFEEITKTYGNLLEIYMGNRRVLVIADMEMAKELLSNRPKFFRRPRSLDYAAEKFHALTSAFFINGHEWNTIRKFTSPSFNKQNVEMHINDVWNIARNWARRLKESKADGQTCHEFKTEALAYTLKVITKVGFGIDETDKDLYFNSQQFVDDLQALFTFTIESFIFPFPMWLFKYFPQYKYEVTALEGDARLTMACIQVIKQRKDELSKGLKFNEKKEFSLLDTLLRKEEGLAVTDKDVLANVKTFYLAGSETTSISIAYAMYYVCQHPTILATMRREADDLIALPATTLDMGKLMEYLPYTEAVLKETLRLSGPASILGHQTDSDREPFVFSNGLVVHPEDDVLVNIDGALRCSDYYDSPWSFLPDRWLDKDPVKRAKCENNFLSFGHGPRVCPGQRLALLEGTLALAALVHELDFKLGCDPNDVHRIIQFTSVPDKMPMIISPRK
jgi:cytochrome P450